MTRLEERPECVGCACGSGCADDITRRDFVAKSTLVAVAAFLAACGNGQIGMTAPGGTGAPPGGAAGGLTVVLSQFPALATVGGMARVDGGKGSPVAMVRTSATAFAAFSMVCPHQGSTINITTTGFKCPNHGAMFDKSGTWTGGQQTGSLTSYPTTYDATAGTVLIGGGAGTGTGTGTGGGGDDG